MERNKLVGILAIVLSGFTLVRAQSEPAKVPIPVIAARVGYTANFSCESYGIPIQTCLWERPAPSKLIINLAGQPPQGYSYVGTGLDKGVCGLLISVVKETDNALWECRLITSTGKIYDGSVRVGILKKPSQPQFSSNINAIKNLVDPTSTPGQPQTQVTVTCGSYGGQPAPTFKWFLGDDELTQASGIQLSKYLNSTDNSGKFWTYQDLQNYKFTWKDNGKALRCVAEHDAFSEADTRAVSQTVNVMYAPRALDEISPFFVPAFGEEAILAINISSNPQPQIIWDVNGTTIYPKSTSPDGRYIGVEIMDRKNGIWECRLIIKSVEEEDLNKMYVLKAKNQLSTTFEAFPLRITSSDPAAGGMSAGGIVGLVLGIPALLILIAVVVVYLRARGLLCFKGDDGTASEKERMDDESAGAGAAAEEKPAARRLSSRLSAIYENLVKKKDKTAPIDEEATKEKEAPEGLPEKKPEDIVYAELDLVTDGNKGKQPSVVRGTDDKTEYAEIVGVVPQGTEVKKDKSPSGSANGSPKK